MILEILCALGKFFRSPKWSAEGKQNKTVWQWNMAEVWLSCFGAALLAMVQGPVNVFRVWWNQRITKAFYREMVLSSFRKHSLRWRSWVLQQDDDPKLTSQQHKRMVEKGKMEYFKLHSNESWPKSLWKPLERAEIYRCKMTPNLKALERTVLQTGARGFYNWSHETAYRLSKVLLLNIRGYVLCLLWFNYYASFFLLFSNFGRFIFKYSGHKIGSFTCIS